MNLFIQIILPLIILVSIIFIIIVFAVTFYRWITEKRRLLNLEIQLKEKELYTDLTKSIIAVNKLKELIDDQIVTEVNYKMKREIYIKNANYDALKYDADVEDIATTVFNYIKPEIILNLSKYNSVFTDEYWLKYIYKKTQIAILNLIRAE